MRRCSLVFGLCLKRISVQEPDGYAPAEPVCLVVVEGVPKQQSETPKKPCMRL